MQRVFQQSLRAIVGGLFVFSGLIKLNDPKGTAIKLEEYFHVFSHDFGDFFQALIPLALSLAFFLIMLEVLLGVACLLLYRVRLTNRLLLVLISFFTALTLYSAYFNKVTDCGCFGDAIPLTPWQSFAKDGILLLMIGYLSLFQRRRDLFVADLIPLRTAKIALLCALVLTSAAGLYGMYHLPFIDFRKYKVNSHLPSLMKPSGKVQHIYVMEKEGEVHHLTAYPKEKGYTFKSMYIKNPEVLPKIVDYRLWNDEGDKTEESLVGNKLFITVQHTAGDTLSEHKVKILKRMRRVAQELQQEIPLEVWVITSTTREWYEHWIKPELAPFFPIYADATLLKTMIRSNPGLLLLQDGLIRGKWHYNDMPPPRRLLSLLRKDTP